VSAVPILFVDHAAALGGAQYCLLLLLEYLDRRRFAPRLATQPGALAEEAARLQVPIDYVALTRLRHQLPAPARVVRATAVLRRIILREQIALVHHNTMRASVAATLAAGLTRRPVVWHVHDIFRRGVYARWMCRRSSAAIAVSAAAARPLPCHHKVHVIPNGVRLEDFSADRHEEAAELRAQWGVPPQAPLVAQIARLQPWKGQRDVIAAAEMLLRRRSDLYFVLVGGDIFDDARSYAERLRSVAGRSEFSRRIVFAGQRTDIPVVLQAVDVLVHASIDEPFGRVLIEAGAAGVPVVAYDGGGVAEIVEHERTGLLVPAHDQRELAAALARVLDAPERAHAMGAAARARVRDQFDARQLTREIESVFDAALTA